MEGEAPERVSAFWPAFGRAVEVDGEAFREVTFVTEVVTGPAPVQGQGPGPSPAVAIVLNGITDGHRADLTGALLDEVPGSPIRVIDYLLPDDLVLSYGFVSEPWLDRESGATWRGWFRIQDALVPDARNPRRLPTQFGRLASVLVGPAGAVHPAWEWPAREPSARRDDLPAAQELPLGGEFAGRSAVVLPWGRPGEVVLLFDGEEWERIGIRPALARLSASVEGSDGSTDAGGADGRGDGDEDGEAGWAADGAVVLVPSGTVEERWAVLPHPERAAALAEAVLDALAGHRGRGGHRPDPEQTIIAGQSFGGLAAAAVVALRPDLATTAIVQSGSFEFAADLELEAWGSEPGDLFVRLAALAGTDALRGRRFLVQSGTEEAGVAALSDAFAAAALAAGATVTTRIHAGGHDYAWWRTALFAALTPAVADARP